MRKFKGHECEVIGCCNKATFLVTISEKMSIRMCNGCRPDPVRKPDELHAFPKNYKVRPIPKVMHEKSEFNESVLKTIN